MLTARTPKSVSTLRRKSLDLCFSDNYIIGRQGNTTHKLKIKLSGKGIQCFLLYLKAPCKGPER